MSRAVAVVTALLVAVVTVLVAMPAALAQSAPNATSTPPTCAYGAPFQLTDATTGEPEWYCPHRDVGEMTTFTLNLATCHVLGSASSVSIKENFQPGDNELDRDCVTDWEPKHGDSMPIPATFVLNGVAPDGGDGTTVLSWSGLTPSTQYTLTDGGTGIYGSGPYVFTLPESGSLTLWAVFYQFYNPHETAVATAQVTPGAELTEAELTGSAVRVTDDVNLRATPASISDVLALVPIGTIVTLRIDQVDTVVDASGIHWWPVSYNGQDGWISGRYLTPVTSSTTGGTNSGGTVSTLPKTGTGMAQSRNITDTILLLGGVAVLVLGGAWLTMKRRNI